MENLDISNLTPEDIAAMSYNELIGLVKETNRPPGGSASISTVAQKCFLKKGDKVLEIGTSTGVTAIELARLTQATIYGIDINPISLEEAKKRAKLYGVEPFTNFAKEDATNLAYPDEMFDVVFCGNVTSLIDNKEKALKEYLRVLKTGGMLVAIPMYYIKKPSEKLVNDVCKAIQVQIKPLYKDFWVDFFKVKPFDVFWIGDYAFDDISPDKVDFFVKDILARKHLKMLSKESQAVLKKKYTEHMHLFRENLANMGYSIILLRKEVEEIDPELFTSRKVSGND